MTNTQARNIIRSAAADRGVKYRITSAGEVHFYGEMPNTNKTGWYFIGWDALQVASDLQSGKM